MSGKQKILVVAGERNVASLYSHIVVQQGYDCITCRDTDEATKTVRENEIDLALVNVDAWIESCSLNREISQIETVMRGRPIVAIISRYLANPAPRLPSSVVAEVYTPASLSDFVSAIKKALDTPHES